MGRLLKSKKAQVRAIVVGLVILSILAGCTTGKLPIDSVKFEKSVEILVPDSLKERVKAYWDFRIKENYDKSWAFEAPYIKYRYNIKEYKRVFRVAFPLAEVEIINYKVKDTVISLYLKLYFKDETDVSYPDIWIKQGGQWFHVLRDRLSDVM